MSEQLPASDLARLIADALEDDHDAIEITEDTAGMVSDVAISRRGLDLIYNAIVDAIRNGGIKP